MMTECSGSRDTKGYKPALHHHPHEQMIYLLSGQLKVYIGDGEQILEKGGTIYFSPDVPHGVSKLEDSVWLDIFTPQREDFLADREKAGRQP